jgi:hypothetical protein
MTLFRVEHKKNYTIINNHICKDDRLSWKAKGIWLYAFSRPDDWEFNIQDLINQSTDGRESVRAGLKELEEHGYLTRVQHRENGHYSKAEWQFHEVPTLEFKKLVPQTGFPTTANMVTENNPLPMPNKPMPEGKLCLGNALLKNSKGNGFVVPSTNRKFKRKPEHQERFEWLMTLELTDENNRISEDEMSFLSHKHSKKQLDDAYCHLQYKIAEGFKPKSIIAVFKHLLKNEHNPRGSNVEENIRNAKSFAQQKDWSTLEIKNKYVQDKYYQGKDISLNMEPMAFFESLVNLYESING